MAETIKGINVVIGAETTGLSAALADVSKKSKGIVSELSSKNNTQVQSAVFRYLFSGFPDLEETHKKAECSNLKSQ
jgi:hypothetical protein